MPGPNFPADVDAGTSESFSLVVDVIEQLLAFESRHLGVHMCLSVARSERMDGFLQEFVLRFDFEIDFGLPDILILSAGFGLEFFVQLAANVGGIEVD